jgi:O-acetyl-ADP-ribose deacetylase (regulator of RNase III)
MITASDEFPKYYEFSGRRIEPYQGDITTAGAAVIVHAVTITATFNNRIAQRILRAAGERASPDIKKQVQSHTPIGPGHVVVTHAGELVPTRYLFHAMISRATKRYVADPKLTSEAVTRCVQLADLLNQPSMALPPLGTGTGRASAVKTVKQMINVMLDLLPTCNYLKRIVLATTNEKKFALFHNLALADIALARREQELKDALRDFPPSLYGLVGHLLESLEQARQAGEHPQQLQQEAEGLIMVGRELAAELPPTSGAVAGTVQLIINTGGSIIRNVTQQVIKEK